VYLSCALQGKYPGRGEAFIRCKFSVLRRNPAVSGRWIPACAGMTGALVIVFFSSPHVSPGSRIFPESVIGDKVCLSHNSLKHPNGKEKHSMLERPDEICGLICFDLSTAYLNLRRFIHALSTAKQPSG